MKRLVIFGCAHLGSKSARIEHLEKYVKLLEEPGTFGLILGDMFENAIPSRGEGMMWDQATTPQEQLDDADRLFRPVKNKIIKACGSNHSVRSWKEIGIDIDRELYCRLGIPKVYAGEEGVVMFEGKKIAFAHGNGSGDNWKDALKLYTIYPDADIVCVSHRHKMTMDWHGSFHLDRAGRRHEKFTLFVRTGGLMDWARYAKRELYAPQKPGFSIIYFPQGEPPRVDCNGI